MKNYKRLCKAYEMFPQITAGEVQDDLDRIKFSATYIEYQERGGVLDMDKYYELRDGGEQLCVE